MGISTQDIVIPLSFLRFDGGINTRFSPLALEENEVVDLENFHLEGRGGLEKRKGYAYWYDGDVDTTDPINGLYYFKPTDAVMRMQDGEFHYNIGAGWVDGTNSETISADPDNLWNFTTFKDYAFGVNGVNVPLKWDGAGNIEKITQTITGTSDDITKAAVCCRHRERIILGDVTTDEAGNPRYASRLWPSAVNTLDTWHGDLTDGKIIDVDEGDGDSITALVDVQGFLVVFKQNSLHRINDYGLTGQQQRIKVANVGTPGPHCVVVVGNIVFFLDNLGQLWAYDATGTNEDKVVNLSERKLGKTTLDLINKTRLPQSFLWHDPVRNEIRYFVTTFGLTETNEAGTFSLTTGGFGRLEYTDPMNIAANYIDANNERRCLVGTYDGGVMLLDETDQDNGTDYTAYVITRLLDFGENGYIKGTRTMHIYATVVNEQDIVVEHRINLQQTGTSTTATLNGPGATLDTFVLDQDVLGGAGDSMAKLRTEAYARWHQFKLTQAVDEELRLIGFVLNVVTSGAERDGN